MKKILLPLLILCLTSCLQESSRTGSTQTGTTGATPNTEGSLEEVNTQLNEASQWFVQGDYFDELNLASDFNDIQFLRGQEVDLALNQMTKKVMSSIALLLIFFNFSRTLLPVFL